MTELTEERKAAERLAFKFLCLLLVIAALVWIVPQIWDKLSPFIIAVPLAALLQPIIGFLQKKPAGEKYRYANTNLLIG